MLDFLRRPNGTIHPAAKATGGVAIAIAIALPIVAAFEGYAAKPYIDRIGTGQPITWCYGETKADRPVPPLGTVFTKKECTQQLEEDLTKKYDPEVRKCVHVAMPPHREAALVSFVYNLGQGALCNPARGTYTAVAGNLNAGNVRAGCSAMLAYDHASGRKIAGLTRRRQTEYALCMRTD